MDAYHFFEAVREMRHLQRLWRQLKNKPLTLRRAKQKAERAVDNEIEQASALLADEESDD